MKLNIYLSRNENIVIFAKLNNIFMMNRKLIKNNSVAIAIKTSVTISRFNAIRRG